MSLMVGMCVCRLTWLAGELLIGANAELDGARGWVMSASYVSVAGPSDFSYQK